MKSGMPKDVTKLTVPSREENFLSTGDMISNGMETEFHLSPQVWHAHVQKQQELRESNSLDCITGENAGL